MYLYLPPQPGGERSFLKYMGKAMTDANALFLFFCSNRFVCLKYGVPSKYIPSLKIKTSRAFWFEN